MKQPLEQHLTETLEARAHAVRDVPNLGERVVTRGRRVRRRRRVYGGLAVVVAVATAVATPTLLVDPDARRTPAPPVTTPTGQPSPSRTPPGESVSRPWDALPVGPSTDVPFTMGPQLFVGIERTSLPGKEALGVNRVDDGYLVTTRARFTPPLRLWLVENGMQRQLLSGTFGSVAVSPDQRLAAWGVIDDRRRVVRTELTMVELPSGKPVATHVVDGYRDVIGFADDRVLLASANESSDPPAFWDPSAGTVSAVRLPLLPHPPDVRALQSGGGLLLLGDYGVYGARCLTAVLTSQPDTALWARCDVDAASASVSADGSRLATGGRDDLQSDVGVVLDARSGSTIQRWKLPGHNAVRSVAWEDAQHVLFLIDYSSQRADAVSALIRCGIGEPACERVPTPDDGYITALGRS